VRKGIKYPSVSKGIQEFDESDDDMMMLMMMMISITMMITMTYSTLRKAVNIYLPMSSQIGVDPRIKVKQIKLA